MPLALSTVTVTATSKLDNLSDSQTFSVQLNGGGPVAPVLTPIEEFGNTTLNRDADGNLYAGSAPIMNGSTQVKTTDFSFMQLKGAETVDGVNRVLMYDTRIAAYKTWSLDANWKITSVDQLPEAGTSQFNALESGFNLNFIDSFGSVPLIEEGGALLAGSAPIMNGSTQVKTTDFSFMQFKGAETVDGVNRLLMYDTRVAAYKTWSLNTSWTVTGIDNLPSNDQAALRTLESAFNVDLDGDFFRGTPTGSLIDSFGSVPLIEEGGALLAGSTPIRVGTTQVTTTDFSFMQFKGAETVDGVNRLLMYDTRVAAYKTWSMNTSWTVTGIEALPSNDQAALRTLESAFDIDLDGDFFRGTPTGSLIDSFGSVQLFEEGGALLAGSTPIRVGTTQVTTTDFSFMQFKGAETVDGVNRLLMYDTRVAAYKTWSMNTSWTVTGIVNLPSNDQAALRTLESAFDIDLDGDFFRGTPTGSLVDSFGSVPLIEEGGALLAGSTPVRVGTTQVTTTDFSFMQFKGAETVDGVNRLLMYDTRVAAYKTWSLNTSWTVTGIDNLPSNDQAALRTLESAFDIDLDGDSFKGVPVGNPIESFGLISLMDAAGSLYAGTTPIRVGNTQITTTSFSFMQFQGAEAVDGINKLLMYDTRINAYKIWELNDNWQVTAVVPLPASASSELRNLENAFDIDLDNDLNIG